LSVGVGNGADKNTSGSLAIFNPSSTTYVKHFIGLTNIYTYDDYTFNNFTAGYGNTTSAVNAVQFKMSSGNMDGTILMYGIV
jgi:chromosomal replication initiation ATPase DnaA